MIIMANVVCRPAGGNFTVEMSANRAFTTLSYNGALTGIYPDGEDHPEGLGDGHTWSVAQLPVCRSEADCLFIASARRQLTCMQSMNPVLTNNIFVFERLFDRYSHRCSRLRLCHRLRE